MHHGLTVFIEALNSVNLYVEIVDAVFTNERQSEVIEAFSFNKEHF